MASPTRQGRERSFRMVCTPGLEALLAQELAELGLSSQEGGKGALQVLGPLDLLPTLHRSRIAERIWLTIGKGRVHNADELKDWAAGLNLGKYFNPDEALCLEVASRKSALWHRQKASDALAAGLGRPVDAGKAGPRVFLRLDHDRAVLRLDCSGTGMHLRAWRQAEGPAPLRGNHAAGLLRALGWHPGQPILDPCCGSGTFLVEAARWMLDLHEPGPFAYESWPTWRSVSRSSPELGGSKATADLPEQPLFFGGDNDPDQLEAAALNGDQAGVGVLIHLAQLQAEELVLPETESPGLVIANPPWGLRMRGHGLARQLAARFLELESDWRLGLLIPTDHGPPADAAELVLKLKAGGRPLALWRLG